MKVRDFRPFGFLFESAGKVSGFAGGHCLGGFMQGKLQEPVVSET
jgi:hypothetical protein